MLSSDIELLPYTALPALALQCRALQRSCTIMQLGTDALSLSSDRMYSKQFHVDWSTVSDQSEWHLVVEICHCTSAARLHYGLVSFASMCWDDAVPYVLRWRCCGGCAC